MPENIYLLKIFEGIDKDIIKDIVKNCELREYSSQEVIIMEGEESNWEWYIIKSWKVSIGINGNHIVDLYEGDIVGEIALLNEEQRTATVSAIEDTTVIVLNINNLIDMINSDENKINKTIMKRMEENLER